MTSTPTTRTLSIGTPATGTRGLAVPAETRAAGLLRADAAVTGLVGAAVLLGPDIWGDVPGWLPRTIGAALVLVAADLAVASRFTGRRLRLATTVFGELALAWTLASVAVLELVDLPTSGREVIGLVAVGTAAFGVAELRAARALR